ncbi:copper resistance CopC family protein [Aquipuribacter sp. MA13-13]|uniref:copper resistance CopC family protein n=1 Tax=Aquipuribacter sp. MA13-13 TaxID=3440840 RepID=UPI003EECD26B
MRALRAAAVLTVLAVAGVLTAAPASAHAEWLGSDPEEGSVLTELPAAVVMTYSEEIAPDFVDTAVVPPGGEPIPTVGTADGVDVVVDLAGAADVVAVADQAGEWQLVARVVSADGHPVEHTTTFEVEPAVAAAPAPAAEPPPAPATSEPPSVELVARGGGADGHPVAHTTTFEVEPAGAAAPTPAAEPTPAPATSGPPSVEPAASAAPLASAEPSPISSDPVADVADGLPGWAVPLVVLALLGAGVAAVVVHLRRGSPEA